jgi:hypothetical protein
MTWRGPANPGRMAGQVNRVAEVAIHPANLETDVRPIGRTTP